MSISTSIPRGAVTVRRLALLGVALCLVVIVLGAWVRLTDAGLGCPDWPGCYGKLTPSHAKAEIAEAVAAQGGEHGPVSFGKAWREMIHRYIAAGLGLHGNESYPGVFEPFGGFADDIPVENGRVRLPEVPGIGIETKAELMKVFAPLVP